MSVIAVTLFAFANYVVAQDADQSIEFNDTRLRQWSDSSGQKDMSARLVSLDEKTKTVVLEYDGATRVEVPLGDLSVSDRKYVGRQQSKARRAAKRASHAKRSKRQKSRDGSSLNTQRPKSNEKPEGSNLLYNIAWHLNPASAMKAAAGKEGAKDDKPIMWFRVLGSLDGYM